MKEIRKWHNTEFYYCCKRSGGYCSGIWTRHYPSKCNPDYVKRFHKYKQKKNNPKKRVTFDNEQNKEKKATPKEKKQKVAQPFVIEAPSDDDSKNE